jgi:DNA-binding transcriptional regulator YhcF (GntR family)
MKILSIDTESSDPPFEQVRSQLATAITTGQFEPEDQLPTVRKLAADLGLAANTVARAYRELELAGIIQTRGRHGSFVAGSLSPKKEAGARSAAAFIQRMRDLGIGDAEMLAIFRNEIDRHAPRTTSRLRST